MTPTMDAGVVAPPHDPVELLKSGLKAEGTVSVVCYFPAQNDSPPVLRVKVSGNLKMETAPGTWGDCDPCQDLILRLVTDEDALHRFVDEKLGSQGSFELSVDTAQPNALSYYLMTKKDFQAASFLPAPCDNYSCVDSPDWKQVLSLPMAYHPGTENIECPKALPGGLPLL